MKSGIKCLSEIKFVTYVHIFEWNKTQGIKFINAHSRPQILSMLRQTWVSVAMCVVQFLSTTLLVHIPERQQMVGKINITNQGNIPISLVSALNSPTEFIQLSIFCHFSSIIFLFSKGLIYLNVFIRIFLEIISKLKQGIYNFFIISISRNDFLSLEICNFILIEQQKLFKFIWPFIMYAFVSIMFACIKTLSGIFNG